MNRYNIALVSLLAAATASFGTLAYADAPKTTAPTKQTMQPAAKGAVMQKTSMMSQKRVEEIQTALTSDGKEHLAIDGIWGPQTEKALRDFQKQNGLPASGRLTHATLTKLNPPHWNG